MSARASHQAQSASDIRKRTASRPLHLLPHEAIKDEWISSKSRWGDKLWFFDNCTKGASQHASTINWELTLPDGSRLTSAKHAFMLDWMKRTAWSLFAAPGENAQALAPGSMSQVGTSLRALACWMVQTHRKSPADLNSNAQKQYVEFLMLEAEEEGDSFELTHSSATRRLIAFMYIWRQRFALERAGIPSIPEIPFRGKGVYAIASEIAKSGIGWWHPLPDEVAAPIVNGAMRLLGPPAEDIINLHRLYNEAYYRKPGNYRTGPGTGHTACSRRARIATLGFKFSTLNQEATAWEPKLKDIKRIRYLFYAIKNAATLVIQATTGMRISEICSLKAGINEETGLPTSVRICKSDSGLYEIFELEGKLSKTEKIPRSVTWTLGLRENGTDTLPPAVNAILILNRLLEPYRELAGTDDLLLNFSTRNGLPRDASSIRRVTSVGIRAQIKDFIEHWVNLSDLPDNSSQRVSENELVEYRTSKGRCIKTHQLRKLFANFSLRVDPSLLPVLQMHFQHVSIAMTDGGYRGHDINLMRDNNTVRSQQAALMLLDEARSYINNGLEAPSRQQKIGGRRGKDLRRIACEELAPAIKNLPQNQQFAATMEFVEINEIRMFFEPHGICSPLGASQMACHNAAHTVNQARWQPSLSPNVETREPMMCAGCASFIVAKRHLPFWETRYVDHMVTLRRFQILSERKLLDENWPCAHEIITKRAEQAFTLCNQLGANIDALKNTIEERALEGINAIT